MNEPKQLGSATIFASVYAVASGCLGLFELSIGWWMSSLAMMADSINMLSDVVSGVVVAYAAYIHRLEPDDNHPFGHYRAEPLGALVMGVVMVLLGLKIVQSSVTAWILGELPQINALALAVPCIIIFFKGTFYFWVRRQRDSPSLDALAIDSRNDVLASLGTLLGLILVVLGFGRADAIVALLMGLFIMDAGKNVIRENIGMLMGERPADAFFDQVTAIFQSHPQVLDFYDLRAHQVGDQIHLSASLAVDGRKSLLEVHEIESYLMKKLQEIEGLSETFLHLEPEAGHSGSEH